MNALLGKGDDGAPGGEVIDIGIGGLAYRKAVDETAVHLVGHRVMNAAEGGADKFCVQIFHTGTQVTTGANEVDAAVVGLRCHYIMLQQNGDPSGGADEGGGVVAISKTIWLLASTLADEVRTCDGGRVHADKCLQGVSSVDVECHADRTQLMSGVEVAALLSVDVQSPVCPAVAKMMIISTFGVKHLSDVTAMHSMDGLSNVRVIEAVLQKDTMALGVLGGVDEGPEVFHRCGGWDFHGHVFTGTHGFEGDGCMTLPVAADVDEVYVGGVAEGVIGGGAVGGEKGRKPEGEASGTLLLALM